MFNNTRLGYLPLLHRSYLGVLSLSFSTHSRILFSSEYFHYKIFISTSRGTPRKCSRYRGTPVGNHCYRHCSKVLNLFRKFCEGFLAGSLVDAAVFSISHENTTLSVRTFIRSHAFTLSHMRGADSVSLLCRKRHTD
jgi:hypothetical protein